MMKAQKANKINFFFIAHSVVLILFVSIWNAYTTIAIHVVVLRNFLFDECDV